MEVLTRRSRPTTPRSRHLLDEQAPHPCAGCWGYDPRRRGDPALSLRPQAHASRRQGACRASPRRAEPAPAVSDGGGHRRTPDCGCAPADRRLGRDGGPGIRNWGKDDGGARRPPVRFACRATPCVRIAQVQSAVGVCYRSVHRYKLSTVTGEDTRDATSRKTAAKPAPATGPNVSAERAHRISTARCC